MKTKLILSIFSIIFLYSWIKKPNEISKLSWLIGTWETKTPKGSLYETWTRKSATEFQGKSYYLNKKDTLLFESVLLVEKEKKLHYIVSVGNQNEGLPVDFVSKDFSDPASLVFENPQHDFPNVITYRKITKDSLIAEISGTINGQKAKQSFPMKKIK